MKKRNKTHDKIINNIEDNTLKLSPSQIKTAKDDIRKKKSKHIFFQY